MSAAGMWRISGDRRAAPTVKPLMDSGENHCSFEKGDRVGIAAGLVCSLCCEKCFLCLPATSPAGAGREYCTNKYFSVAAGQDRAKKTNFVQSTTLLCVCAIGWRGGHYWPDLCFWLQQPQNRDKLFESLLKEADAMDF